MNGCFVTIVGDLKIYHDHLFFKFYEFDKGLYNFTIQQTPVVQMLDSACYPVNKS